MVVYKLLLGQWLVTQVLKSEMTCRLLVSHRCCFKLDPVQSAKPVSIPALLLPHAHDLCWRTGMMDR